jgi:hypothetical protein
VTYASLFVVVKRGVSFAAIHHMFLFFSRQGKDYAANAGWFRAVFEVGRRYKVAPPSALPVASPCCVCGIAVLVLRRRSEACPISTG